MGKQMLGWARRTASALTLAAIVAAGSAAAEIPSVGRRLFDETEAQRAERMQWWVHDRFGMFIHFGLYALPAKQEWIKKIETIPEKHYDLYFRHFNPDRFDAKAWAKAAKTAGMKYAVLTAKHHEGFCLWDSAVTDYKVTNTAFGRDLVAEFVAAFRAEGLKVGFYYSLIDWHHPDFTIDCKHPRRPKWDVDCGTVGDGEADYPVLNAGKDMAKYRQYMKDQVTELLTRYGDIDILWFDFTYPEKNGKTSADWDSEGLLRLVRRLRPNIIVNNRLGLYDTEDGWDFVTPEQFRVEQWPTVRGRRVAWETCQTFSGSWGYSRDEATWKSPEEVIGLLVHSVSKGGNLIINVGPTARGNFDARARSRLEAFAKWMYDNDRAVYGCTEAPAEFKAPANAALTWNPATRRLYVHLLAYPGKALVFDFADRVEYAQFLHDGSEVRVKPFVTSPSQRLYRHGAEGKGYFDLPAIKPDTVIPVIEVLLKQGETK